MKKAISLNQITTLSKWYGSENFSSTERLCLGKYTPQDNLDDEYIILLKWDISTTFSDFLSFDKVLLRLYNMYKPDNFEQNIYVYESDNSFDSESVTWNTKPHFNSTPMIYTVSSSTYEKSYIDIDVTSLVRKGLSGMNLIFSLAIKGDPSISNSIIYFDLTTEFSSPELIIEYSSTEDAFGLFINNSPTSFSNNLISPGRLSNSNQIHLVDTPLPNSEPVVQIDYPGIYEITLTAPSINNGNGYFYLKLGNLDTNIEEYSILEHISFSNLSSDELSLIISIPSPNTLLALFYSENSFNANSLILSVKRISLNNIIEQNLDTNPFIGQKTEDIQYHFFAEDDYSNMTLGLEDEHTFIRGNVSITGDLQNSDSLIVLQNITFSGELSIDIGNGSLFIENCSIETLTLVSCNYSGDGLYLHEKTNINQINISNTRKVSLKIHEEDISSVKVDKLHIHPQSLSFEATEVSLEGHFGMCEITIDRSVILNLKWASIILPITLAIDDTYRTVDLQGSAESISFSLLSNVTLSGEALFTNSSFLIDKSDLWVTFDGVFSQTDLYTFHKTTLSFLSGCSIKKLVTNTTIDTSTNIYVFDNCNIAEIQSYSPTTINGEITPMIKTLISYRSMTQGSTVELSPLNESLSQIVGAINILQTYFIEEISDNISLSELDTLVHEEFPLVSLGFLSITENDSLLLDSESNSIQYSPISISLENIYKHECSLLVKVSYFSDYITMPFILKAKYTNVRIDYNSLTAYVQNSIESLQFAIDYPIIEQATLIESYLRDTSELFLNNRNIKLDLNSFSLQVKCIKILDSHVKIYNGDISPINDISQWQWNPHQSAHENLIFLYIDEYSSPSSLILENITISLYLSTEENFNMVPKQVSLIQGGCVSSIFSLDYIKVRNVQISLIGSKDAMPTTSFNIYLSFAKENHILDSNFSCFDKCITISSAPLSLWTTTELSNSYLGSPDTDYITALELIPYDTLKDSSLLINGDIIRSNMSKDHLINKVSHLATSLVTSIPRLFNPNSFSNNSWLTIWENQNKENKESLRFNGSNWDVLASNIDVVSANGIYRIFKQYETLQFQALLTPSDASLYSFNWSVAQPELGWISSEGLLTATAEGIITVNLLESITGLEASTKVLLKFIDPSVPPEVSPQSTNNDLEHVITFSFTPTLVWSNNITSIKIENSKTTLLDTSDYEIHHENGKITVNNVIYSNNTPPIYTDFFEVGDNIITIYSDGYLDISFNQVITPRQIIHTFDGKSEALMRFSSIGDFSIEGIIHKSSTDQPIASTIDIMVVEESPRSDSIGIPIDSSVYLIFPYSINSIDATLISISEDNGTLLSGLNFSIDQGINKLIISHSPFTPSMTYSVKILKGSITLTSGKIQHDIIWSFSTE